MCVCLHMCICYLANPLALHNKSLHLGEVVIVGYHIGDDGLFVWVLCVHICTGGRWRRQRGVRGVTIYLSE